MRPSHLIPALIAIFASASASAKITLYSNQEALSSLLASTEFQTLINAHEGQLDSVAIKKIEIETASPSENFEFQLSFNEKSPAGITPCVVSAEITLEIIHPVAGITASQLGRPRFGTIACAP